MVPTRTTFNEGVWVQGDHIAGIDPMRNPMRCSLGHVGLAVGHPALDLYGAADGIDDARNSAKKPSPIFLTIRPWCSAIFGLTNSRRCRLAPLVRALLIRPHQSRIARDIGGEDGSEAAARGHDCGRPPGRNSSSLSLPQLAQRDMCPGEEPRRRNASLTPGARA
jgi:hypothetical protein